MSQKFIPVEEVFREWRKDPEFVAAYEAIEDEFAMASALIKARGEAAMTQEQVAQAMGTTQAVVARLESGKTCLRRARRSASRRRRARACASASSRKSRAERRRDKRGAGVKRCGDLARRMRWRRAAIAVLAVKVKPPSAVASQELSEP
jgi:hypothetical protein